MTQKQIESTLESMYKRKFNRTQVEKHVCQDCFTLVGFRDAEKKIVKFVDWTTNTVYLKTDVDQPLYLTDPDAYADTFEDRTGFLLLSD